MHPSFACIAHMHQSLSGSNACINHSNASLACINRSHPPLACINHSHASIARMHHLHASLACMTRMHRSNASISRMHQSFLFSFVDFCFFNLFFCVPCQARSDTPWARALRILLYLYKRMLKVAWLRVSISFVDRGRRAFYQLPDLIGHQTPRFCLCDH